MNSRKSLDIALLKLHCAPENNIKPHSIFSQKGFIIKKSFETKEFICSRPRPICAQQNKTRIDPKDSMHSKQVQKHADKTTQLGLIKIGVASDMQINRFK